MILIFGPAGSGKSLQGQILAARYGYTWISVGRLLRAQAGTDPAIQDTLQRGELLPAAVTNRIVNRRLDELDDLSRVILDGYPRSLDQAESLTAYANQRLGNNGIETIIVLDLGRDEVLKRLLARHRSDDTAEAISRRLDIFVTQGQEILDYYDQLGVRIDHVPANRTVGQVHDSIASLIDKLQS